MNRLTFSVFADLHYEPTAFYSRAEEKLAAIQQRFYANSPLVEALPAGKLPKTASVAGTARAQVGVAYHVEARMIVAIGAIDNLGKGAAGQAVQCANIIFGLNQTEGLTSLAVGV